MIVPPRGASVYSIVSDLINPLTKQWDIELFESLFCQVDVDHILQIPLHNRGFDDFVACNLTEYVEGIHPDRGIMCSGGTSLAPRRIKCPT
jgi:hypothetical protein